MIGGAYGLISIFSSGLSFLVHLAVLIVVITAVRSRRPDAWFPLAIAAALFLLQSVLGAVLPPLLGAIVSRSGSSMDGYMGAMSGYYFFGSIMNVIGWGLMMLGLVKLASPPQELSLNRSPGGY